MLDDHDRQALGRGCAAPARPPWPSPAGSCRRLARPAGPAWARWPGHGRSPAGACRRRAGCGPARRPCRPGRRTPAARPPARSSPAPRGGTSAPDHRGDHALPGAAVPADQHVLAGGHVREQAQVLEGPGDAELGDPVRGKAVDPLALEQHVALAGGEQPGDAVEEGLAGPVGPDQADDLALADGEVDLVHRHQPPNRRVTLRASRIGGPSSWGRAPGRRWSPGRSCAAPEVEQLLGRRRSRRWRAARGGAGPRAAAPRAGTA